MLNKLLNWFRPVPRWQDFADKIDPTRYAPGTVVYLDEYGNPKHPGEQWRTNFSLTAAQRSERSRKGWVKRKANKVKLITIDGVVHHEDCVFLDSDVCNCGAFEDKSNGE